MSTVGDILYSVEDMGFIDMNSRPHGPESCTPTTHSPQPWLCRVSDKENCLL